MVNLQVDLQLRRSGDPVAGIEPFEFAARFEHPVRVLGVYGPSGVGKSTLLNLIAGLQRPETGRVALDGVALQDSATGTWLPPHRRRLGVVFQDARLFPHLSVAANLDYGARASTVSDSAAPAIDRAAVIELLALGALLQRGPASLSGGERQRVALGRALLTSPRLLLMDEPLAGLDPALKAQILPFLRRVHADLGVPMLYVSHHLSDLLQLTQDLLLMQRGRVQALGSYRELAQEQDIAPGLIGRDELVNILPAIVEHRDADTGCLVLRCLPPGDAAATHATTPPLLLHGPGGDHAPPIGSRVQLAIRPEDLAVALAPVGETSIQNQFPGHVARSVERDGRVLLEVVASGVPLFVEISPGSAQRLGLVNSCPLFLLLKANAVRYESVEP